MQPYQKDFLAASLAPVPQPPLAVGLPGRQTGKMYYAYERLKELSQAGEKCLYATANEAQAQSAKEKFRDYPNVQVAWTAQEIQEIRRRERKLGALHPGQPEDILSLD